MEKPENVLRSKTTNRQTTFKITIFDVFVSRLQKRKRNLVFNTVYGSLVGRRLLCSKYGRQRGAPTLQVSFTKEFFSFLYRMVLFLSTLGLFFIFSFLFFYQGVFSALDFSVSKDFSTSKELLRVTFLKCAM